MAESQTARFAELLRSEEGVYSRVLELSRQQTALVKSGESAELLKVLAAKGTLVAELEALATELGPLKEGWKGVRDSLPDAERSALEAQLEAIAALLEQIIAEDGAVEKLIGESRGESLERIRKVQTGRKLNKAYGDQSGEGSRFTDSKR